MLSEAFDFQNIRTTNMFLNLENDPNSPLNKHLNYKNAIKFMPRLLHLTLLGGVMHVCTSSSIDLNGFRKKTPSLLRDVDLFSTYPPCFPSNLFCCLPLPICRLSSCFIIHIEPFQGPKTTEFIQGNLALSHFQPSHPDSSPLGQLFTHKYPKKVRELGP